MTSFSSVLQSGTKKSGLKAHSDIGIQRSPVLLQRAILAPDDQVLPKHRFIRVVTSDGTAVVGRLLNQDAFSVQLMDREQHLRSYLKSNLRES